MVLPSGRSAAEGVSAADLAQNANHLNSTRLFVVYQYRLLALHEADDSTRPRSCYWIFGLELR